MSGEVEPQGDRCLCMSGCAWVCTAGEESKDVCVCSHEGQGGHFCFENNGSYYMH